MYHMEERSEGLPLQIQKKMYFTCHINVNITQAMLSAKSSSRYFCRGILHNNNNNKYQVQLQAYDSCEKFQPERT